ncbi:hypothetical protein FKP32DRAFT_1450014 [Trametes sanguinea]|nr:hypothetical protein FKP32DRAFT_1450014 [Trametes sanguinea]
MEPHTRHRRRQRSHPYKPMGMVHPTHKYIIRNEVRIWADLQQGLTDDVRYLFARTLKTASSASPVFYADLTCERGRCLMLSLCRTSRTLSRSRRAGRQGRKEGGSGHSEEVVAVRRELR